MKGVAVPELLWRYHPIAEFPNFAGVVQSLEQGCCDRRKLRQFDNNKT
jgi:hypothetical protein